MMQQGKTPTMVVLETCDTSQRQDREREWISAGKSLGWRLTNNTDGGDGAPGGKWTEERRQYMSEFFRNREFSEEHRRNISHGLTGKTIPEETKFKMAAAKKGKSAYWNVGLKRTEESKQKMRDAWKRRKESGWVNPLKRKANES
jgi:hypothetical protein